MDSVISPRTTLHALRPIGPGTPEVESLTSYFCRLAYSHGMSAQKLADWMLEYFNHPVCDKYGWHQRKLASLSVESEQWSAWLAELTGTESLDRLTLVPWRHVLGTPGLAPKSDHWCPHCLAEDKANGKEPYLRLAWDVAPVTACLQHRFKLTSVCPHCARTNVRNRAAIVVPGYCTACGGFLGDATTEPAPPEALWTARQVGLMLQDPPRVAPEGVLALLETVIERLAGGNISRFAKQFGFSKSGVWHWLKQGGLPSLGGWLTFARYGGIGLDKLFAGELNNWVAPCEPIQQVIPLPASPRTGIRSRELDWEAIRETLQEMLRQPEPISVNEASKRLGIDRKHFYLRANAEARALADRYRRHRAARVHQREERLQARIGEILDERLEAGYEGLSAREVWGSLTTEANGVTNVFQHISQVMNARSD